MTKSNFLNALFYLTIIFSAVFFCLMHFFKFNPNGSIGYASVALCFLTSLLTFFITKNKVNLWFAVGLLFTCFADIFLVLLHSQQALAMFLFSITQISYFIVLYYINKSKKQLFVNLILRTSLFIILFLVAWIILGSSISFLVVVSLFYFSNLFFNVVFSGLNIKKCPLLFCGLLLFLMCDIIIGLNVLSTLISSSLINSILSILNSSFDLAWFFYIPSQLLISLSSITYAKNLLYLKSRLFQNNFALNR